MILDGGEAVCAGEDCWLLNDVVGMGVRGFRVDASKHMWPGDLDAMLGMTQDINGWRAAALSHEVIDMGGGGHLRHPSTQVGKVTEFRYGHKMAQCNTRVATQLSVWHLRPGWGMVDGMSRCCLWTTTTTREAKWCGGVITRLKSDNGNPAFHNDWQYKVAVAFMLWP